MKYEKVNEGGNRVKNREKKKKKKKKMSIKIKQMIYHTQKERRNDKLIYM